MPERAIFLDRDNTIIEDPHGYLGDPAKVKLLPGAAAAILSMHRLGYRIIVASNQSGVARGMFTEDAVQAVNDEMTRQLREQTGAQIDASYYCPYHPDAKLPEYKMDHEWRKPRPGMLLQAAEDFSLELGQSWMIGDMPRDIACGAAAGCRTILLRDPDRPAPENESNSLPVSPNFIVKSLADAARIILREGRNPHPDLVIKPISPATPPAEKPAPLIETPKPAPAWNYEQEAKPQEPQEAPPAEVEKELPVGQEIPEGSPPHIIVQIDEQALADRIAQVINQVAPAARPDPGLRPVMDEILVQLRHQSRQADMPDFSMSRLVSVIVQIGVALCLLMGTIDAIQAFNLSASKIADPFWFALAQCVRSGLWLLAGILLQGFVLALLLGSRKK